MRVLIVGAGPTGLTLASELIRHGVECRLVDQAPHACQQSRALGIHARTLEHFEMMGVLDEFLKEGNQCSSLRVHEHEKVLLTLSLDELASPYPFVLLLPQSRTEELLAQHLEKLGGIVERQTSFEGLQQNEHSVSVTLRLPDGTSSREEYAWVIGCDGAHSPVRHAINAPFHGSAYSEAFLLADVATKNAPDSGSINMYTTDEGILGVFSFGSGRARIIADAETVQVDKPNSESSAASVPLPEPTLAQMQEIVAKRGPANMQISDPQWLAAFRIHRRQVDNYKHDRVFLAGDAAHIHSPAGGQGMNTGIQDAINLAWKLALVQQGHGNDALLKSYNQERHAVGLSVLKLSDFLTRVNTTRNHLAQHVRNKIAPILAGQELIQQRMRDGVAELAINYRKSPIVAEHRVALLKTQALGHSDSDKPELFEWFEFDKGPRPGDRAPDAHFTEKPTGRITRLFELLQGTEHQLLLFAGVRTSAGGNTNLVEVANFVMDNWSGIKPHVVAHDASMFARASWTGSILEDVDLSLHHRYGASSECLYLLRPDGYVAFRSLPVDKLSLEEYVTRVLN